MPLATGDLEGRGIGTISAATPLFLASVVRLFSALLSSALHANLDVPS